VSERLAATARFFQKRRIEKEGATIDEGVIGHLERLSRAAGGARLRQNRLIHLQVRLEFQSVAGIPTLLACERGKVSLLEGSGEFGVWRAREPSRRPEPQTFRQFPARARTWQARLRAAKG